MVYDELLEIQETNVEVKTTKFRPTYEYRGHRISVAFTTTI
jgi:hypothetical protein